MAPACMQTVRVQEWANGALNRDKHVRNVDVEKRMARDQFKTASSGHALPRGIVNDWTKATRGWNDEGELPTGMDKSKKNQGRLQRRSFDSLGGGVIPIKRGHHVWRRDFDSIGGGLIPPLTRGSDPAKRS